MFAEVIVDINNVEVDKVFEYSFSDCKITLGSRVVVPFGKKMIEGIVIGIKEQSKYDVSKIKPIYSLLEETPALTKETLALMEYITKTCYVTRASALRLFLPSEMRKGKVKEQFTRYVSLLEIDLQEVILSLRKTAVKQKELLEFLSDGQKYTFTELAERFGNSAVNTIVNKGYAQIIKDKSLRSPYKALSSINNQVVLTDKQTLAVESIKNTDKTVSLIFGVTGSGKTEVYLNLINDVISKGKSAIMLVPEIALTPQMLKQLRARFSNNAAILHSGLSAGERFDEWWRLRNGEAKIAIGARSAIFAPLENLGLIIIDEEHDGSYTSESAPRYNTIDIAKYRAELCSAKLVLGSATPSIESYKSATIDNVYNLIELPDRINKRPLPQVDVVDMRREVMRGNNSPFSSLLKDEIGECLEKGNQAIIFLNQRGYSKTVICTECGHVQKCSDCDVSLTYHKEDESLLCHYCGAKYKMIDACTECGSLYIRYGGTGTERVVLELKKLFPNARIVRMDRDTTQSKEGHFNILNKFTNREADILVGTQMIAKGHDFPFVTLVGILDADMSLHFSDFRSGERTFQLLTQVAGRSGRAKESGKVVLQTYSPDNTVLRQAIRYDYKGFFNQEISIRKATGFPPYSDIVRVLISSEDDEGALNATKAIYEELGSIYSQNKQKFKFFGCMKAPLKRLQNKFRYQILMRIDTGDRKLLDTIFTISDKYKSRNMFISLEINSNNLT